MQQIQHIVEGGKLTLPYILREENKVADYLADKALNDGAVTYQ